MGIKIKIVSASAIPLSQSLESGTGRFVKVCPWLFPPLDVPPSRYVPTTKPMDWCMYGRRENRWTTTPLNPSVGHGGVTLNKVAPTH